MPTAEPQPISDHFRPALCFVVRPHYGNSDHRARAASRPAPPWQGSWGRRLGSDAPGAESCLGAWHSEGLICAQKL